MTTHAQTDTRLRNPWLTIARVTWIAVVSLTMALFAAGLLVGLGQLRTVCTGGACHPEQLAPAQAELNRQLGLSLDFYAGYTTIVWAIFGSVFFAIAGLIFWRRSDDRMALFVSLFLVMLGAGANPVIPTLGSVIFILATTGFVPLFSLFPDGRFVPRWTRWLVLGWIVSAIVNFVVSPLPSRGISTGPPDPIFQGALLIGVGSQIYRYWRVSTPLQRQQTKWTVLGFAGWFVCLVALLLALAFFPALSRPGLPGFFFERYAFAFVGLLPILFIPVSLCISILRYRLWDIDLIIRRTLIYGVLTAMLSAIYFGGVVVLQSLFRALTGQQQSEFVTVASTLAIAALFLPLRRRMQDVIDRRFYRKKYDAAKTLAAFATTCRDETDLDKLTASLVNVVQETMQPAHVSLWLRKDPKGFGRSAPTGLDRPTGRET